MNGNTYSVVTAIGVFEVQDGRPVVGEIFRERASCAG